MAKAGHFSPCRGEVLYEINLMAPRARPRRSPQPPPGSHIGFGESASPSTISTAFRYRSSETGSVPSMYCSKASGRTPRRAASSCLPPTFCAALAKTVLAALCSITTTPRTPTRSPHATYLIGMAFG